LQGGEDGNNTNDRLNTLLADIPGSKKKAKTGKSGLASKQNGAIVTLKSGDCFTDVLDRLLCVMILVKMCKGMEQLDDPLRADTLLEP
jgi:hypothetical protein